MHSLALLFVFGFYVPFINEHVLLCFVDESGVEGVRPTLWSNNVCERTLSTFRSVEFEWMNVMKFNVTYCEIPDSKAASKSIYQGQYKIVVFALSATSK